MSYAVGGAGLVCRCPGCQLRAALELLDDGRPAMARTLVAEVFRCLSRALADAYARGRSDAATEIATALAEARARRPSRRATRDTRLLVELVLAVGVDPILNVLHVDPPHLIPLLEGRVTLAPSQRSRLRALLGPAREYS